MTRKWEKVGAKKKKEYERENRSCADASGSKCSVATADDDAVFFFPVSPAVPESPMSLTQILQNQIVWLDGIVHVAQGQRGRGDQIKLGSPATESKLKKKLGKNSVHVSVGPVGTRLEANQTEWNSVKLGNSPVAR